jgi:hypothetical protein
MPCWLSYRAALTEWLTFLKEKIGFDSWRLDFAKG